ncbi:RNA polymerase sigma factor [Sorangium sp. So ce131]|uniref:RNA polymerase sigma factor n=1 Tax=Sorangium sp. So ce131 TaxID=3133282 RepID=UPI003F6165DB
MTNRPYLIQTIKESACRPFCHLTRARSAKPDVKRRPKPAASSRCGVAVKDTAYYGSMRRDMSLDGSPEIPVEELIGRARAGDHSALEELFGTCRPMLERWAALRLKDVRSRALRPSDVAQEASLRAFEKFSTFTGITKAEWLSWLHSVLRNYALQALRDEKRGKRDGRRTTPLDGCLEAMAVPTPQQSPSQEMMREEQLTELLAQIYELPDDQGEAIYLCHLRDFPVAEVAQRMGKTEAAVAGLLRRGLKALRSRVTSEREVRPEAGGPEVSPTDAAAALLLYLRRRDAGERLGPEAFLADHPACAHELRPMLEWIERIQSIRPASLALKCRRG